MRRIRKLRGELWGSNWPEINNMFEDIRKWPKPKFMNWESFNFKRNKIIELEKKYWPIATAQLSRTFSNYNYLIE